MWTMPASAATEGTDAFGGVGSCCTSQLTPASVECAANTTGPLGVGVCHATQTASPSAAIDGLAEGCGVCDRRVGGPQWEPPSADRLT